MPPFADYRPDTKRNLCENFNHPTILHIRQPYSSDHLVHLFFRPTHPTDNPTHRQSFSSDHPLQPTALRSGLLLTRPSCSPNLLIRPTNLPPDQHTHPTNLHNRLPYSSDHPTRPTIMSIRPTHPIDYPTYLITQLTRPS